MAAINAAIQKGVAEKTVLELMNPEAQLPQVYPFAADLYQKELATLQQQSPEVSELSLACLGAKSSRPNLTPAFWCIVRWNLFFLTRKLDSSWLD